MVYRGEKEEEAGIYVACLCCVIHSGGSSRAFEKGRLGMGHIPWYSAVHSICRTCTLGFIKDFDYFTHSCAIHYNILTFYILKKPSC